METSPQQSPYHLRCLEYAHRSLVLSVDMCTIATEVQGKGSKPRPRISSEFSETLTKMKGKPDFKWLEFLSLLFHHLWEVHPCRQHQGHKKTVFPAYHISDKVLQINIQKDSIVTFDLALNIKANINNCH